MIKTNVPTASSAMNQTPLRCPQGVIEDLSRPPAARLLLKGATRPLKKLATITSRCVRHATGPALNTGRSKKHEDQGHEFPGWRFHGCNPSA
eukprot:3318601-Pyramimonas_sp.AAC.4